MTAMRGVKKGLPGALAAAGLRRLARRLSGRRQVRGRPALRLALGGLTMMTGGALLAGRGDLALCSLLGGLGYTVAMLALHVLSRGGLGMGDVKLAGGLGVYTGVLGPTAVLAAGVGAILLGGVVAGLLVLAGRATGRTALPFGPAMVAAAAGVLVLA